MAITFATWPPTGPTHQAEKTVVMSPMSHRPSGELSSQTSDSSPPMFFIYQWIGLREILQESPIFNGKNLWFPVKFPLNQSNQSRIILFWSLSLLVQGRNLPMSLVTWGCCDGLLWQLCSAWKPNEKTRKRSHVGVPRCSRMARFTKRSVSLLSCLLRMYSSHISSMIHLASCRECLPLLHIYKQRWQ